MLLGFFFSSFPPNSNVVSVRVPDFFLAVLLPVSALEYCVRLSTFFCSVRTIRPIFLLFLAYHLHIHCRCHIKWNVYVHAMQVQKTASAGKPVATIRISVRCTRCSLICFANLVDYLHTFYVLFVAFLLSKY